jgi:hypothetical protein
MPDEHREAVAERAYTAGREAALDYFRRGIKDPPTVDDQPFSLTQLLKGSAQAPTEAEMREVAAEWRRGVDDAWLGA